MTVLNSEDQAIPVKDGAKRIPVFCRPELISTRPTEVIALPRCLRSDDPFTGDVIPVPEGYILEITDITVSSESPNQVLDENFKICFAVGRRSSGDSVVIPSTELTGVFGITQTTWSFQSPPVVLTEGQELIYGDACSGRPVIRASGYLVTKEDFGR
ncbi:MAG: hypothetical protein AAGH41_09640 [Pseudomonadota bacterium]